MAHGGKRPGSGRKTGSLTKNTLEIRELAKKYAPDALERLAQLMTRAESESACVAACNAILDRAYGKAPQALTGEGGEGPIEISVSWEDTKE